MGNFKRTLFVLIGLLLLSVVGWLAIQNNVIATILSSRADFIPIILLLFLATFLLKSFRWMRLLSMVTEKAFFKESFISWCSSYFLSYFTPGRILEPVRSLIYKRLTGVSFTLTAPLVIIERFSDLVFFILVSFSWLFIFSRIEAVYLMAIFLFLLIAGLLFIKLFWKSLLSIGFSFLEILKFRPISKEKMQEVFSNIRKSIHSFSLVSALTLIILTIIIWMTEAVILSFIIQSGGESLDLSLILIALSISTILALFSAIPAGIGIIELSLSELFIIFGLSPEVAIASALLYRAYSILYLLIAGLVHFYSHKK